MMKHAIRLTAFRVVTAIVLISLVIFIPGQVRAAPGDETSNPQLSLVPAIENLAVSFSFDGDNNGNNQASLYYRQTGTGSWKPGIQMTADRRSQLIIYGENPIPNPFGNQWRAIIFGLNTNTSYDVRVDFTDIDGGSGTVQTTVTTINANPPSNGNTYYVSKGGSDTSGDGSQSNPWLTIQKAADNVSPGDRVRIMPGTYNEQVVIRTSGTANNYITFESNDPNNLAIVTYGIRRGTVNLDGTDYIRLRNLYVRTTLSDGHAIRIEGNAVANIVEGCEIDAGNSNQWWNGGIWLIGNGNGNSPSYTVIQNNTITTQGVGHNGPFGILMWDLDVGGTTIKGNTISGQFYDGIATIPNFGIGTVGNFFIYDNDISSSVDDNIEVESGGMNVGIWNNRISNSRTMSIAAAPCAIGPMYIFRNVITGRSDAGEAAFKLGSSSYGHIYFYHNTIYKVRNAGFATFGSNSIADNIVARNNIIEVELRSQYVVEEYGIGTMDFDYNSMYSPRSTPIKWAGTIMTWADWRANHNQEANGIWGQESFVNAAGGNFYLQSNATSIDRGVIIPGFNDANSPWPYSGNGPDIGAYEYTGAPPADITPPYTSGHNPQKYSTSVAPNTNIAVHIRDTSTGVDQSTIEMRVEGSLVSPTITGTPYDYTVTYDPPVDFDYEQVVNVTIDVSDLKSPPNVMNQESYNFTIESEASGNDPPVASNDQYGTDTDSSLSIPAPGVLDNDNDADLDSLTVVPISGVSHGSLTLNSDGSFIYTPDTGYSGLDAFSYQANDGQANSNTAIVSINISSGNQSPVAFYDQYGTDTDSSLSIAAPGVLGNDNDVDLDTLTAVPISGVSYGNLTLNSDGSFIYTPYAGYSGLDAFSYQANDGQANSNIAIVSINVGSGGSGGGGGTGGSGGDDNIEITSVFSFVTSSGKFNIEVVAQSSDNNVKIKIPRDTIGTNSMGVRLTSIVIEKMMVNMPPPPDDAVIVGSVYDLTPDGAIFDPAVYLSMSYSDNQVPNGVSEKNLIVGIFNWSTGEWQTVPSSTNLADNTVTANLEHFSTYALLAYIRPASFEIADISSPDIVTAGNNVDIQATVVNTGDLTGDYEVALMLDDEVLATELITLDGGDSTILNFSTVTDVAGIHRISIGAVEKTFTTEVYEAPAKFITSNITVTPSEIYLGAKVEISTLISNIGDLSGFYEAILKMDNEFVDSENVDIAGGDSEIIIFTVTPETEGEHAISIGEKVVFFTVKSTENVDEEIITMAKPEISRFDITPTYNPGTGKIESTRIDYQLINSENLDAGSMLILKVFREGELWEEIPLITLNQLETDQNAGYLSYIPSEGWSIGTYIFEAELREQNGVVHSIQFEKFTLIEESITKAISWGSLGIIIGGTLIVLLTVLAIVIYRRREMLRGYVE